MAPRRTTNSTTENPGDGQPLNQQNQRFAKVKATLKRENLERGYQGLSDHAWYGMGDVWWALTHPHKAIARNIGQLSMVVVLVSAVGATGYLFFGEPGSAQLSLEEPGSVLKVAGDEVIRPVGRWLRRMGSGAIDSVGGDDETVDGDDYRE